MREFSPSLRKLSYLEFCLTSILIILLSIQAHAANDIVVYEDDRATGWQNYSYGTTVDFSNTSQVHQGTRSISVSMNGWAGFYLHQDTVIDLTDYQQLNFWIRANSNCTMRVFLNYDSSISKYFSLTANIWTQVTIPLSELGTPPFLTDIQWMNNNNDPRNLYIDDIKVTASTTPLQTGPSLSIDVQSGRHAISEDIYGMNFANGKLAEEIRLPVNRWGGNATSRYNWKNDMSNRGSDWYYENIPMKQGTNSDLLPEGSAANEFIDSNLTTSTDSLMTAPLIGWVPKERKEGHPYDCGFSVVKYGSQQSVDWSDTNCGNGVMPDGKTFITGNDPTDTSVAIGPLFVEEWIEYLVGKYSTAANGGVKYYNLDNEPMLWNSTQRDVHPEPASYDEIRDKTFQYGAAIKNADPSAKTLGPAVWGWCAYYHSAVDDCYDRTDYQTHGNTHFIPWYLQEMNRYEQENGKRILDYLDLHIYPQSYGVYHFYNGKLTLGGTTLQNRRLRSVRQLWDETYDNEGWIKEPVYLIPRMKQWINDYYPGTKTAITEYNWGANGYLSGALAQADILGVFGREGLDLATMWAPPAATEPVAFAFRLYRNYDGSGKGFGETSVKAESSDQDTLSIYAAERSIDNTVTVMVINKKPKTLLSTIDLNGFDPDPLTEVYRYSSSNLKSITKLPDESIANNKISTTFPGNSITLFVISFTGIIDSDTDGIADNWELLHFDDLSTADSNSDYDKDGYSDRQEYINSTASENDPDGNPYNPKIKNAPEGTGYIPVNKNNSLPYIFPLILTGNGD